MQSIPRHIAIIMDGNGRWAKAHHLPKAMGHRQGMQAAEQVIKHCRDIGIKYLTLYAFSVENWQRSVDEVHDLMNLMRDYLHEQAPKLIKEGARLSFIGDRNLLDQDIVEHMQKLESASAELEFHLILAISYGSRDEIRQAAQEMAIKIEKDGLDPQSLPANFFDQFLQTTLLNIPDPDLLIRTGGDLRISNFLLWQLAYTELYFCSKYWPEFGNEDLDEVIAEFVKRERRYGK